MVNVTKLELDGDCIHSHIELEHFNLINCLRNLSNLKHLTIHHTSTSTVILETGHLMLEVIRENKNLEYFKLIFGNQVSQANRHLQSIMLPLFEPRKKVFRHSVAGSLNLVEALSFIEDTETLNPVLKERVELEFP